MLSFNVISKQEGLKLWFKNFFVSPPYLHPNPAPFVRGINDELSGVLCKQS